MKDMVLKTLVRPRHLVQGLKLFTRFETYGFPGRNRNLGSSSRISADAGLSRAHVKNSKAPQLDTISLAERLLHSLEYRFDRHLRFCFCDAGSVDDLVNDVQLDQAASAR